MKRYRCTNFFIDCIRNVPDPNIIREEVTNRYGTVELESKIDRYNSFRPPSLRIITEYHNMLREIEDCFIYGLYYPTVTSASCLGERIFNILILRLRDYYKSSPHYKHIYRKDSFDDWNNSVDILRDWGIIQSEDVYTKYKELSTIRHGVIHFNILEDIESKALEALRTIYAVTSYFFGLGERQDIYFWCSGEIYVKKEAQEMPFVKEFILPHSHLVGYQHKIETIDGQWVLKDNDSYENKEVSDEEFISLRIGRRS